MQIEYYTFDYFWCLYRYASLLTWRDNRTAIINQVMQISIYSIFLRLYAYLEKYKEHDANCVVFSVYIIWRQIWDASWSYKPLLPLMLTNPGW